MIVSGSTFMVRRLWRIAALGVFCTSGAGCGQSGVHAAAGSDGGGGAGVQSGDAAGSTGGAGGASTTDAAAPPDSAGGADVSAAVDSADHRDTIDMSASHDAGGDAPIGVGDAATTDVARLSALTVEALQVAGTHNSYHQAPLVAFDASHAYTHKPLDQQLAGGVRALELDLHLAADGTYDIYHIALIDPNSSCAKLDDCLNIIATWSTAHPRHVPIFVWFEIKDDTGGSPINDLVPIEAAVLRAFSRDRVITPAWLRGSYASPRERLMTAGWPTVDEARGKVMFTIINHDARTAAYAHNGTSLDDRLMWLNAAPAEFAQPWAVITKDQEQADVIASAHAAHLLLGLNTCTINMTDGVCTARSQQLIAAGIHTLDDDLPFQIPGRTYWLRLPEGSPGCNPVTAPLSCSAAKLE